MMAEIRRAIKEAAESPEPNLDSLPLAGNLSSLDALAQSNIHFLAKPGWLAAQILRAAGKAACPSKIAGTNLEHFFEETPEES
ncbi:MAG: hypothetical protein J4G10_06850 [Alphaproteobacteria bacterium]|nr:hypothetical protein [Alphaproteobacteria bacterium]